MYNFSLPPQTKRRHNSIYGDKTSLFDSQHIIIFQT